MMLGTCSIQVRIDLYLLLDSVLIEVDRGNESS